MTPPPVPPSRPRPARPRPSSRPLRPREEPAWREVLLGWPGEASAPGLAARAGLLGLLASGTVSFVGAGMDAERLTSSFLHLVNLPFHEAGHVLLSPFEGHDWEYLLTALGLLERDVALGRSCFALGAALMLASLAWGGLALWRKRGPSA